MFSAYYILFEFELEKMNYYIVPCQFHLSTFPNFALGVIQLFYRFCLTLVSTSHRPSNDRLV